MNSRSIRFKLITWYAGLLASVFLILGITGYWGLKFYLLRTTKETLTKRARLIASTVQLEIERHGETYVVADIDKHYAPESNGRFLRITRGDGSIIYSSGLPQDGSFDPLQILPLQIPVTQPYLRQESPSDSGELLIYTLPFSLHDGKNIFIETGVPIEHITGPLSAFLIVLVLVLPIVLAVAICGGLLLIKRALIPVDRLTQAAAKITSENLKQRLPLTHTGDELERLSLELNNMIVGLEKAFHYVSQFTADASHELRTPLTVMHCELETIIQKPHLDTDVRERIGIVLGETERLAKIVDGLLTISRLDAGETKMEKQSMDLAELAMATVDQMRLLAEDKTICLYCYATPEIYIEGDASRLKQVIVNLLDNAIKYTAAGGTIKVNIRSVGTIAVMEITDNGIGISPTALPQIFERFYRADKARSREQGSSGLGLSIVKSICMAHGGDVTVQSKENQGSCFCVTLPLMHKRPIKDFVSSPALTTEIVQ